MSDSSLRPAVSLTTGLDVITANGAEPLFVRGTYSTLNSDDRLIGGPGYDVLSLAGEGYFDLSKPAEFSGFEEVRLANAPSGYTSLTLRDGADLKLVLGDGATSGSAGSSRTTTSVVLGTGRVDIHGGDEDDNISVHIPSQLAAGDVIDGGGGHNGLALQGDFAETYGNWDGGTGRYYSSWGADHVYDLTSITLKNIQTLYISTPAVLSVGTIVKVDTAHLMGLTTIRSQSSFYNTPQLVTAEATLDLTGKTVRDVLIKSSNSSGTVFTTDDAQTALQIKGGPGQDTVILKGLTLTEAQRDQIFSGSIEAIQDAGGLHRASDLPGIGLTVGADVATTSAEQPLVSARASMLNAEDRLIGTTRHDVLSLLGSGSFDLSKLAAFIGFEEVRLTTSSPDIAFLTLRDAIDLKVTLSGSVVGSLNYHLATNIYVSLGTGRVDLHGGEENDFVRANKASDLVAGSTIDGGGGYNRFEVSGTANSSGGYNPATGIYTPEIYHDVFYDLTTVNLKNIDELSIYPSYSSPWDNGSKTNTIVKVDTRSLDGITAIQMGSGPNLTGAKLTTAAATLDLTGKTVRDVVVESSNASGTVFTTDSAQTALQIRGGKGQDTLIVNGLTLTEAQRAQIFRAGSIETIQDASGTATSVRGANGALQEVAFAGADGSLKTDRYAPDGTKLSQTYIHDGVREEHNYVVTGKPYARQDAVYDANDKLISMERTYADGKPALNQVVRPDGSQAVTQWTPDGTKISLAFDTAGRLTTIETETAQGVRTLSETRAADGSKEVHHFDGVTGKETGSLVVHADKSQVKTEYVANKPYAEQTLAFDAKGKLVSVERHYGDGTLNLSTQYKADGTAEVHGYDTAGRETVRIVGNLSGERDTFEYSYAGASKTPTTTTQTHYGTGNVKLWSDRTAADGSHSQVAKAAGAVLVSHAGVADTFTGFKGGADTFVFAPGFGKDVVKGFEAGSGSVHDLLTLDDRLASSFAELQSHMTKLGGDTLLSFGADTIVLKGVAPSALIADDVHFVHHDLLLA